MPRHVTHRNYEILDDAALSYKIALICVPRIINDAQVGNLECAQVETRKGQVSEGQGADKPHESHRVVAHC